LYLWAAEFIERLGDLGFFRNRDVFPDFSVSQLNLGGNDAIGIDAVARMQQEIRPVLAHGGEGEHAAVVGIDAPALSGNVAAPHETDVAPVARRGAESPDRRLADNARMRQVAKTDAVEDVLTRGQVLQQHFGSEITFGQCRNRGQRRCILEGFRARHLDQHLRRPIHARPHHAAIAADVTGLYAMGDLGPVRGAAEIGHRNAAKCGRRRGGKKAAARQPAEFVARNTDGHAAP
jgi:hypothetical protein